MHRNENDTLHTWKEIASYLHITVRTCYRWEKKYGMPVLRLDEVGKSRVFAAKDELDRWLKNRSSSISDSNITSPRKVEFKWIYFTGFIISLVLILAIVSGIFSEKEPIDFRIENSKLIILGKNGRKLWTYDTKLNNLKSDIHYKAFFQVKTLTKEDIAYLPHLIIKDIDKDGHSEVLFSVQTEDEFNEGKLICFNQKGNILWEFKTDRELLFGTDLYSSDYRILGFDIIDTEMNGESKIFVISIHKHYFPCRLNLLNSKGETVGEYWNSGYFQDFIYTDLNEDGNKEIIVVGQNNEYRKACIAVLDTKNLMGSSPQFIDKYKCDEFSRGNELFYILMPRTDVDLNEAPKSEALSAINLLKNKTIEVHTFVSRLYLEFSLSLEIINIHTSHAFETKHANAVLNGLIKSKLNDEYLNTLEEGILYFNGSAWVSEPAMSSKW